MEEKIEKFSKSEIDECIEKYIEKYVKAAEFVNFPANLKTSSNLGPVILNFPASLKRQEQLSIEGHSKRVGCMNEFFRRKNGSGREGMRFEEGLFRNEPKQKKKEKEEEQATAFGAKFAVQRNESMAENAN